MTPSSQPYHVLTYRRGYSRTVIVAVFILFFLMSPLQLLAEVQFVSLPDVRNRTSASIDVVATLDQPGGLFSVAINAGTLAPSPAEVVAGLNAYGSPALSAAMVQGTTVAIHLSSLGDYAGQDLDIYSVAVDAAGTPQTTAHLLSTRLFIIDDDFGGMESVGASQEPLNNYLSHNAAVVQTNQIDGRYNALVTDNTDNRTLFYRDSQGRMDLRKRTFPFTVIARNLGVAPVNNPIAELVLPAYAFSGLIVHDLALNDRRYTFLATGHRGNNASYTIEGKTTSPLGPGSGASYVTDEGDNSSGQAITHADIKIVGLADGTLRGYYQRPNLNWRTGSIDNWIPYNGNGSFPAPVNDYGGVGDEVYVGIMTFAYQLEAIPFIGVADAIESDSAGFLDPVINPDPTDTAILIDFYTSITAPGNVNSFQANGTYASTPLINNQGEQTSYTIDIPDAWLAASTVSATGLSQDFPWPAEVATQTWYRTGTGSMLLSGFNPGESVELSILLRHTTNYSAYTDIIVNGDLRQNIDPFSNTTGSLDTWQVAADSNGEIAISFGPGSLGGTYFQVSALSFKLNDPIDSDGDGVLDDADAFPLDPQEWLDTDGDGIGDNTDTDDDADGIPDQWEIDNGLDPTDPTDAAYEQNNDGITNLDRYIASLAADSGLQNLVGIPTPAFGLIELAPASPNPWTKSTEGFYFINPQHPAAADSGNPFGTPQQPRLTMPDPIPAGSVLELHGVYNADLVIRSLGTIAAPVFVRGVSAIDRPALHGFMIVESSSYTVIENMFFQPLSEQSLDGSSGFYVTEGSHHISFRNSEISGINNNFRTGGTGVGSWNYAGTDIAENIVFSNLNIHDIGDVDARFDQDAHAITIHGNAANIWILNNIITRSSGDGIQIEARHTRGREKINHIYIAGNNISNNKQTGIWVKHARDIVVSSNDVSQMTRSDSSTGACVGYQYTGDNLWFVNNTLHQCEQGIIGQSADGDLGFQGGVFEIGNLIYDISSAFPNNPHQAGGIVVRMQNIDHFLVNNSIINADRGIAAPINNGVLQAYNNLITSSSSGNDFYIEWAAPTSLIDYNLMDAPDASAIFWTEATTLTQLQTTTGQCTSCQTSPPGFTDPASKMFLPLASSATVNSGTVSSVYQTFEDRFGISIETDISGNNRPIDEWDIGAHEFNNSLADSDGDGIPDYLDLFPNDPTEWSDNDQDGVGNNADPDDDNDGADDASDAFPLDATESIDTDNDGIGNNADPDDDNDGVEDSVDAFPLNASESVDTDNDGIGNNADTDDDNDGADDASDAFPLNASESVDTDNDGIGNNADTDDDNDGMPDQWENAHALNPLNAADTGLDSDGDGTSNLEEYLAGSDPNVADLPPTYGTQVLVDFYTSNPATGNWNSFSPGLVYENLPLLNFEGNTSPHTLTTREAWIAAAASTTDGLASNFEWPPEIAAEGWYNTRASSITITGFVSGDSVYVQVLNRQTRNFDAFTDITINGDLHENINPYTYETGEFEIWEEVIADDNGNVTLDFDLGTLGGQYIGVSAIVFKVRTSNDPADSDNDGMPDDWEISNGFDPTDPTDALIDSDGDGLANLEEYLAGTDPNDNPTSTSPRTKVLIDFNAFQTTTDNWNVYVPGNVYLNESLIDSEGDDTPYLFTNFQAWIKASGSTVSGLAIDFPWPSSVAAEGWYNIVESQMEVSGFLPGERVKVGVLSRHTRNFNSYTDISINGDVRYNINSFFYESGDIETWDQVLADENGVIKIDLTFGTLGGQYIEISAISFEIL